MDGSEFLMELPVLLILGAFLVFLIVSSLVGWTAAGAAFGLAATAGAGFLGIPVSQTAMLTVASITGALGLAVGAFRWANS